MSDETPRIYDAGSPAWGQRIADQDERPTSLGYPDDFVPADAHRLRTARLSYLQADPADFDRGGKRLRDWTDRATGRTYRQTRFDATIGDPRNNGVELFVVVDNWMAFLRPTDYVERELAGGGGPIIERQVG